eukprot:196849-Chlamydomonas_euryale.AAC.3
MALMVVVVIVWVGGGGGGERMTGKPFGSGIWDVPYIDVLVATQATSTVGPLPVTLDSATDCICKWQRAQPIKMRKKYVFNQPPVNGFGKGMEGGRCPVTSPVRLAKVVCDHPVSALNCLRRPIVLSTHGRGFIVGSHISNHLFDSATRICPTPARELPPRGLARPVAHTIVWGRAAPMSRSRAALRTAAFRSPHRRSRSPFFATETRSSLRPVF